MAVLKIEQKNFKITQNIFINCIQTHAQTASAARDLISKTVLGKAEFKYLRRQSTFASSLEVLTWSEFLNSKAKDTAGPGVRAKKKSPTIKDSENGEIRRGVARVRSAYYVDAWENQSFCSQMLLTQPKSLAILATRIADLATVVGAIFSLPV